MKVKGSINDERIQKVLTYALVQEQNPGVRLRAINAIGDSQVKPDPEIKKALITTLKSDENAGVRREALSLLQKFPFDQETKEAFLYVLEHDKNAALRIAVIQSLSTTKKAGDKEVMNVLKERVETDNNNFIRMKAKAVLQEVSEQ
jgi:HEAT repeat protein